MTGTAAEVTPVRELDALDGEGKPVHYAQGD